MSRSCLLQHPNLVASKGRSIGATVLYLQAGSFLAKSVKPWPQAHQAHQADETGSLFYRRRC
jgi:hypothetical protein